MRVEISSNVNKNLGQQNMMENTQIITRKMIVEYQLLRTIFWNIIRVVPRQSVEKKLF